MANEQHAWTGRHMPVVRNIDEHLRANALPDPSMKNDYCVSQFNRTGLLNQNLKINMLYDVGIDQTVTFAGADDKRA